MLFATSSFWQGVDVQGEQLSCVIIDRLPFAVPSDPVVAARVKSIDAEGGNAFFQYQVPAAVITLKQGFGRLIRSLHDRGLLVLLDNRILKKQYGRVFVESLPPYRRRRTSSGRGVLRIEADVDMMRSPRLRFWCNRLGMTQSTPANDQKPKQSQSRRHRLSAVPTHAVRGKIEG